MNGFVAYSHRDKTWRSALQPHLALLRKTGLISTWSDRAIRPGESWEETITERLESSDVILLLVSADFLVSDFIFTEEIKHALARHAAGEALVVPIIVRPCDWEVAPFATLQPLPTDGRPVTSWPDSDAAWTDVTRGLRKRIDAFKRRYQNGTRGAQASLDRDPYYLRRLELENVRGFDRLELDFDEPVRKRTVVVGRNGTCKTTLLRSIALGLAAEKDVATLVSASNGRWVTEGETRATVRLHLESTRGGSPALRELELSAEHLEETARFTPSTSAPEEQIFLCAYGMGRGHFSGEPGRGYRVTDSVATLFRYEESLVQSELVLRRLYDFLGNQRFTSIMASLKRALGLGPEHDIDFPPGGGVEISGPDLGGRIPIEGWADGYRMTFSWMLDFYGWAMRAGAFDAEGEVRGILLVDEIEQHLHPTMQRDLLAQLAKALPRMQIVVTTHSPLVALSARSDEIVALHREGSRIRRASVPALDGYSADDVLVEESLFGTDPYAPATRQKLERQQELKRIPTSRRSLEEDEELHVLASELDAGSLPTLRDDPVITRLDKLTALLAREGSEE